jgi:EAL domain-containing protein (putative c-di-GMP-specific phosphodiesterase class I)
LTTIAEGLETRSQLDQLRALGCELAQAFFFAKPLSERQLRRGLENGRLTWPTTSPGKSAREMVVESR